ncbi:hypothetical protein AC579_2337 [Pseudocercospora musae]|uniref:Uncharacterized protein n=1 Tax=Pseudocercospora musae TaxID=113226 RepID=A0A139IGJ6_9PEZI|nr:hypothetical protein AC579_2337 [Pseudocercospora musae]
MTRNGKKSRGYRFREQDSDAPKPDPTPGISSSNNESTNLRQIKKDARTRKGRRFSMGLEPEVDVFDEVRAITEEREAAQPVHILGRDAKNRGLEDIKSLNNAQKYSQLPASEKKAYRKAMAARCGD